MFVVFSPPVLFLVLAQTERIAMKSEECEDAMMILLFCGHGMRKCMPCRREHYSLGPGDIIL